MSSYYVACYLGGFSVPLLVVGVLSDVIGLTAALACLSAAAASGRPGPGRSACARCRVSWPRPRAAGPLTHPTAE